MCATEVLLAPIGSFIGVKPFVHNVLQAASERTEDAGMKARSCSFIASSIASVARAATVIKRHAKPLSTTLTKNELIVPASVAEILMDQGQSIFDSKSRCETTTRLKHELFWTEKFIVPVWAHSMGRP
jgi:hypothetical protein